MRTVSGLALCLSSVRCKRNRRIASHTPFKHFQLWGSYCFYDCLKWPIVKVNDPNGAFTILFYYYYFFCVFAFARCHCCCVRRHFPCRSVLYVCFMCVSQMMLLFGVVLRSTAICQMWAWNHLITILKCEERALQLQMKNIIDWSEVVSGEFNVSRCRGIRSVHRADKMRMDFILCLFFFFFVFLLCVFADWTSISFFFVHFVFNSFSPFLRQQKTAENTKLLPFVWCRYNEPPRNNHNNIASHRRRKNTKHKHIDGGTKRIEEDVSKEKKIQRHRVRTVCWAGRP